MSTSPTLGAPGLSARLTLIIEALRRAVADHAGRHRASAPLVLLLWPYLGRVAARFEALMARVRSGRLPASRPQAPATRTRPPRQRRLSGRFAWIREMTQEAASLGSQLTYLLADPEMAAFLEAEPRAGRILRPLCRMLGLTPCPNLQAALFAPPARPVSPIRPSRAPIPADASGPIAASFATKREWPAPA